MEERGIKKYLHHYLIPVCIIVGLMILWQILCTTLKVPVWLLPAPSRIYVNTTRLLGSLPLHTWVTLYETVAGFILALLIGLPLAVMVVYSSILRNTIYPILLIFQSVPKVAIDANPDSSSVPNFIAYIQNTDPGSNAGIPGLQIPLALGASSKLPVGLELDGPSGSDRKLIAIGLALEDVFGRLPAPKR